MGLPNVAGCYPAADDIASIIVKSVEALSLYAEGCSIVEPRCLDDTMSDQAAAAELLGGAFVVAIPLA